MKQLNVNVTPQLEQDLRLYMKKRGLATKSDAIRQALHEAISSRGVTPCDYRSWLGLGLKVPLRNKRRFTTEDDLWS